MDIEGNKERFLYYAMETARVTRQRYEEVKDLINAIEYGTDFFTAPASSKYHLNCKGGLCLHSLHVHDNAAKLHNLYGTSERERNSLLFCALFHDLCKANFYKVEMRNKKNENGEWIKVPTYVIDDQAPLGHGEKSVILLQKYVHLSDDEIYAINWHMGFSDIRTRDFSGMNALHGAFAKCPMAVMLHMADLAATFFDEAENE